MNKASGFLRRQLGNKMRLRIVPTLNFRYDVVQEDAARISSLIDDAIATNTTIDEASDQSIESPLSDNSGQQ